MPFIVRPWAYDVHNGYYEMRCNVFDDWLVDDFIDDLIIDGKNEFKKCPI